MQEWIFFQQTNNFSPLNSSLAFWCHSALGKGAVKKEEYFFGCLVDQLFCLDGAQQQRTWQLLSGFAVANNVLRF